MAPALAASSAPSKPAFPARRLFSRPSCSPVAPMGCQYLYATSPYGNAIEETQDPGILFPVFFNFSGLAGAAGGIFTISYSPSPNPLQFLTLREIPTILL